MTPDAEPAKTHSPSIALQNPDAQVRLSRQGELIEVYLPDPDVAAMSWLELWDRFKQRLKTGEVFWQQGAIAHLIAGKHLLDSRQLQGIAEALAKVGLDLRCVVTARRQTAVTAAGAGYSVQQDSPQPPSQPPLDPASAENWAEPLYIKSTVRSGQDVTHPGTIIVMGDANPGSHLIAAGDILVLGRLRGIAHAGSQGNRACQIFALRMEAMQLRIADAIARPPEADVEQLIPEMAYLTAGGIRLAQAWNFFKTHTFAINLNSWVDNP